MKLSVAALTSPHVLPCAGKDEVCACRNKRAIRAFEASERAAALRQSHRTDEAYAAANLLDAVAAYETRMLEWLK